ncbi:probable mitochondrial import receptor subunit TOM20 [Selaginella moellendorffii]|uniref:probable mitochondrial import receptor subunit TOM20 n=1 Tax=Selaginella moellendorffii TaxID=88036 RepID=UPI000D1CEB4D|nr:probable mitochondrial import receptor subunit TOM20 [Selaginella moellendorffii]XP_024526207.1 probable mitochondrial import receptor subunit TOM20 [Selaginella moellendorffii]|eukprot:XP_024526201.1 probable mitochondrial import receptor subunit TOM20 [Selaginella moellendorffii]
MDSREDMERLIFFEATREKAAANYARCPEDADNLTQWGGALLELAHFRQGQDQLNMIEESESKLREALAINPKKHETLWCLGNSHTAHGFLLPDSGKANEYFKKASDCFKKALDEEPKSELYMKSLEMSAKAPNVYVELQRQVLSQQLGIGGSGSGSGANLSAKGRKKKQNNDFKYDVLGWAVLVLGVVAWLGMAKIAPPRAL